jgi:long-subunit acyl-CoA synthetase (AMP-forming)
LGRPAHAHRYYNKAKKTAEALTPEGWFRTGDVAQINSEGFIFIVDRIKDLVIRGGENISCKCRPL